MMNKFNILFITLLIIGCSSNNDWTVLFDGETVTGLRGYKQVGLPNSWEIVDGTLKTIPGYGVDLISEDVYNNFELELEWKVPEGGNSGIFYHLKEGYSGPPVVAPEYQLLDDENYAQIHNWELKDWELTAGDYAMHVADKTKKILYPPGQWNSSRIIFTHENVEHWLNGIKVLSFVPWSEDWEKRRNSGKWNDAPDYGKYKTGYIGFQDHGSNLSFRNIKIKKL